MRTVLAIAAIAACSLLGADSQPARGAAAATGNLRLGGTARGDISASGGETDTISIHLERGSSLNVKWKPTFHATLGFVDPSGSPVALGLDGSRTGAVQGWAVPATGTYEFHIGSADGTQGAYTLSALPYWEKKLVLTGTGDTTLDVPMPATGAVKGKVLPLPGASNPSILSFESPLGTELLVSPIVGSPAVAKLKTVTCADAGVYRLTATAGAGTKQFQASITRKTRKLPKESINIANGIDATSYATGGVADYFDQRCAVCHDWARSYAGVRAYASAALGRMQSGNMPQGGPRATSRDLALVAAWIKTGYGK